jgi:OOP family OmpA-OmpF porin
MLSLCVRGTIVLVAMTMVFGCAMTRTTPTYEPHSFDGDLWVERVDKFVVILDDSKSMREGCSEVQNIEVARRLVRAMSQTIPALDYEAGLRTFGQGKCLPAEPTSLLTGVGAYSARDFGEAVDKVTCAGGKSPLDLALDAAAGDLGGGSGKSAVIVVSDGRHMGEPEVAAAKRLAEGPASPVCIYTVLIGHSSGGESLLQRVADASDCGGLFYAKDLQGSAAMGKFVEKALLAPDSDGDGVPDHLDECPDTPRGTPVDEKGCSRDSDGDGVPDHLDRCPGTPKGVKVDEHGCPIDSDGDGVPDPDDRCPGTPRGVKVDRHGCPLDSDGDGVLDHLDKCPGTPRGVPVDETGCPPEGIEVVGDEWIVRGRVLFDTDKWDLKPEGKEKLAPVAEYLKTNRQWLVEIEGHTDSTGPLDWNLTLSQRRAESVKDYLVSLGVEADRLTTQGVGPKEPMAENDTPEGRAQNRRVDFRPSER